LVGGQGPGHALLHDIPLLGPTVIGPERKKGGGMTWIIKGCAILWLLLGVLAYSDKAVAEPERPLSEVMWQTAIHTLESRGMTIQTASKEKGWIITEIAALDPRTVSKAIVLNDQDQGMTWMRAEYRYLIGIGARSDNAQPAQAKERILVKAEIWAWEQDPMLERKEKRAFQSNNTLEQEFLQGFMSALARVDER
jgi:hypothetical protein